MTDQIVQRDSAETADPGVIQEILDKNPELNAIGAYQYGWADSDAAGEKAVRGLNEDVVRDISGKKDEPEWMRDLRLKALKYFERAAELARKFADVTVRSPTLNEPALSRDLAALHGLSLAAFAGNPLYSPLSLPSFEALYRPLLGRVPLASAVLFDLGVVVLVVGATVLTLVALAHQSLRKPKQTDPEGEPS